MLLGTPLADWMRADLSEKSGYIERIVIQHQARSEEALIEPRGLPISAILKPCNI